MDKAEISFSKLKFNSFKGYKFEKNNFNGFCSHRLNTDADEYCV